VKFDRLIGKLGMTPDYCGSRTRSHWAMDFEIRDGDGHSQGIWVYHKGNTIIMLVFSSRSHRKRQRKKSISPKSSWRRYLMKLVSRKELHNEWMQDDEYRAAWRKKNVRKSSKTR
jgi:hypothetical protein